jgi:hypothetical protein
MFRIRSKLDEIVQLALRNMSQEKEFDGLGL